MRTKNLEKVALGVGAVLCILVVALVAYRSGKRAADVPPVQSDPTEPVSAPAQEPDGTVTPNALAEGGASPAGPTAEDDALPAAPSAENNAPPAAPSVEDNTLPAAPEGSGTTPAAVSASNDAPPPASSAPKTDASGSDGLLSAEDAKAVALAHAGLAEDEVTFTKQKLEWEDRRQVYEIEFYTPAAEYDSAVRTKYDYKIDAATGDVVKFDYGSKSSHDSVTPADPSGTIITQEKAQEIALAKVPGASADNVKKLKLDRDDGMQVYEVEIVYNGMEYDLDIRAADGTILEFEADPIHD